MIRVYGIPNCDTVKKARRWLEEQDVAFDFVDFKKQAPDAELLNEWLTQIPLETLLNKRGTTWRKLDEATQALAQTRAGAVQLMVANPSMIKRPVLAKDGRFYAGFAADVYQDIFAK